MQNKPRPKLLKLSEVRRHPELQPRVLIDPAIVEEYRDAIKDGAKFPAVTVFFDKLYYYLADGWHRYEAHQAAGVGEIQADVYEGSFRDAKLFALGANGNHGLRRTNEDKRRAVAILLADSEWSTWSDRDIAKACRVSHPFVLKVRNSVTGNVTSDDDSSLATTTSENEKELTSDESQSVAPRPSVSEEVRKKADDIRAAGGEPRYYKNKHGSVGVMNVSKVGRNQGAQTSHSNEGVAHSDVVSHIEADEDSSKQDVGPSAEEIAFLEEQERADREKYDQLVEIAYADDKLSESMKIIETQSSEIARLRAEIGVLRERQTGLLNEKVALESAAKRWRRIAEQHGYSDKGAK